MASDTERGYSINELTEDVAPGLVVVPDALRDRINTVLDEALAGASEEIIAEREHFYGELLRFFCKYGYVPNASDLQISQRAEAEARQDAEGENG